MSHGYLEKMLIFLTGAYNRRDIKNAENGRPMETNIGRLFSLLAGGFDMVHTAAETVRVWDNLDNAEGAVLDRYGANFGVARGAASDPLYRILIRVKMLAQLSGGDDDTIILAAAELLGVELADICLEDVFPAKKMLFVNMSLLSEERLEILNQITQAIKRILAAGVGLRVGLRVYPEKAAALAGGAHIGTRREIRTAVAVPALEPPGGTARAKAYGALRGASGRLTIAVEGAQRARPPAGAAAPRCGAVPLNVYQRVGVVVQTPAGIFSKGG